MSGSIIRTKLPRQQGAARFLAPAAAAVMLLAACGGAASPASPVASAGSVPPAPASAAPSSAPASIAASAAAKPSAAASASAPAPASASGGASAAPSGITAAPAGGQPAADCPNGGTVRFGVETFETAPKLATQYNPFVTALATSLGCKVELNITTSYNAEIEAMRAGKLEIAEYGPLGYVLAHQVAKAEAVATFADKANKPATYFASVVTWKDSGIKDLKGVAGKTFAYSDPSSTSGHLFPAYALKKVAGIDPDNGVKAVYAGSHTSSFEALRNHKVDAGELNSDQIASASREGIYKDTEFPFLWKSDPIPQDPITVRGDLNDAFKKKAAAALMTIDMTALPKDSQDLFADLGQEGPRLIAQTDSAYDNIRDLVSILNVDLSKL